MMRWAVIFSTACMLVISCASGNDKQAKQRALAGTHWKLIAWSNPYSNPLTYTITADFSKSQLSGISAVNTYSGSYTTKPDGGFLAKQFITTRMAGPEKAMRTEAIYLKLLQQAQSYTASQTTLKLLDSNHQEILIFNAR